MGFDAPHSPAPTADERELLLGFARWQREQVVATTDGLSDDQVWWTPREDRLLSIGGIVNHLTHMEFRWIEGLGDEGGRGPAHELLGFDRPVSLRWALLHVIEETAHHAGHADATRELLDSRRMRA